MKTIKPDCKKLKQMVRKLEKEISRYKQIDTALRESEERYRNLLNITPVAIGLHCEGEFIYMNPEGLKIFGAKTFEEFRSRPMLEYIHPDFRQKVKERIRKNYVEKKAADFKEQKYIRLDGRIIDCETGNIPCAHEGKPAALVVIRDVTDRGRIDKERRLIEFTIDSFPDEVFWIRKDGTIDHANKAACLNLGYTHKELLRMNVYDVNPDLTQDSWNKFWQKIKTRRHMVSESRHKTKDGMIYPVEISTNYIEFEGREYCFTFASDITDRKQAERNLLESEERLALALKGADLGLWDWDIKNHKISFNDRLAEMQGYSYKTMKPSLYGWEIMIHPDDRNKTIKALNEHLYGLTPFYEAEYRVRTNTTDWVWILDRGRVTQRDEHGKPIRATGTHLDITKRKHAEKALLESGERYRTVFETAASAMLIIEENKIISLANKEFEKLSGYSRKDIEGKKNWTEFVAAEDLERMIDYHRLRRINKNSVPDNYEARFVDRKGKIKNILVFASLISGTKKSVVSIIDITEKKHMETQLNRARRMEAIGTLAGGIAHDFNNILTAIIGCSELALDEMEEGSIQHRYIQDVLRAGERAKDLVKQILTFSRQNEGKPQAVQVHLIVKEALKLLRSSIPSTITIVENIDVEAGTIMADPTQIHQIIINLCSNAYQAMEEHGGTLTVSLENTVLDSDSALKHSQLDHGPYMKLTISDTGVGIDAATMEHIFDPFFTTKTKDKGTGLGLATVHGIVANLKGAIYVDSQTNVGTTFTVYLQCCKDESKSNHIPHGSALPEGTGEFVIFVDDEEAIARMGQKILESIGYRVATMTSSVEALEYFRTNPEQFDLVITDMTMPDMTGMDMAQEILRIRPNIPIILCSGFSQAIDKKKAKDMGIREYIEKPVNKQNLASVIRKVLDKKIA